MKIDGVELTTGYRVLITSRKPRWWRFRAKRRWKKTKDQNGIYTVTTDPWEKKNASE